MEGAQALSAPRAAAGVAHRATSRWYGWRWVLDALSDTCRAPWSLLRLHDGAKCRRHFVNGRLALRALACVRLAATSNLAPVLPDVVKYGPAPSGPAP